METDSGDGNFRSGNRAQWQCHYPHHHRSARSRTHGITIDNGAAPKKGKEKMTHRMTIDKGADSKHNHQQLWKFSSLTRKQPRQPYVRSKVTRCSH
jgi:hypothetical protein